MWARRESACCIVEWAFFAFWAAHFLSSQTGNKIKIWYSPSGKFDMLVYLVAVHPDMIFTDPIMV